MKCVSRDLFGRYSKNGKLLPTRDILRRVKLSPYRSDLVRGGSHPRYELVTWDCGRPHHRGYPQQAIGYELVEILAGKSTVIFTGEDFGCSPMHSIDSDECIAGILNFLTLRKGDTDAEYFEAYNETQIEFRDTHAEALSGEICRFSKGN